MRKLVIGLSGMAFVVLIFILYAWKVDTTPPISTQESADVSDMKMPDIQSTGQQTGDKIGGMEKAKYVKYNEQTKDIELVYGFNKLLNPGAEATRWEVEKPYLVFYQKDYKCRIDSDTGTFQMESGGMTSALRDAQLAGHVVIHIIPESNGKIRETFIRMDDLTFSSERSEFATDGPVSIKSEQGMLEGIGMILLFDTVTGKIDFLNIRDLSELRVYGAAQTTPATETETTEEAVSGQTQPMPVASAAPAQSSVAPTNAPAEPQQQDEEPSVPDYYQCIFENNVVIEYGNKLIVAGADQVNIQNIIMSSMNEQDQGSAQKTTAATSANAAGSDTSDAVSEPASADTALAQQSPSSKPEPEKKAAFSEEVVVRCDGGIILKPMAAEMPDVSAVGADLSVEMRGAPLLIDKVVAGMPTNREPLVSCGALTYTPMEDILRLFTHEQQPEIVLTAEQSRSHIQTFGNVWWNRKSHEANIAGPGKAYLSGSDVSKEPAEVSFQNMDLIFAQTPDMSDSPSIQTINLTGGMDAVFKEDGWYEAIADSARLEFGDENTLSEAFLLGQVEFKSLEKEKPQRAVADAATFEFGPENALDTAYMQGGVEFESTEDGKKSRATSDEAKFYFDQSKIRTADLKGDVQVTSETGKVTSTEATIEFAPDESGSMQPGKVVAKGDAVLETVSEPTEEPKIRAKKPKGDAKPTRFEARRIDYDLQTGAGLAHGPIHFRFYQLADETSDNKDPWVPITVTSEENAVFVADENKTVKQVVFNGNVYASRVQETPKFVQLEDLHGEKLTVDLVKGQADDVEISRITMSQGDVFTQSQRLQDEKTLSDIKLYCSEIVFNEIENQVLAKGPGKIEINNSQATGSKAATDGAGINMDQPCYAYVEGFDLIQWDLDRQKLVADGQKDQLKIFYIPLLNGAPEKYIYVSSMRFDLSFGSDNNEKFVLQRIFTDQGIVYIERDKSNKQILHHITGQTLDYDVVNKNGWVKIEGTPEMPCNVDNYRTPYVFVHPATGELKTPMSTMPGVVRDPNPPQE